MKEQIKQYILNNKKLKEIKDQEEKKDKALFNGFYLIDEMRKQGKTQEEIKQYFLEKQEEEEKQKQIVLKLQDKKKACNIKQNILYNNIIYLIYNQYKNNIDEIMLKYKDKNIGEKTKEKIQEEIKSLFLQDDVFKNDEIFIYIKNNFESYERYYFQINIEISKKEYLQNNGYKFIYNFKFSINYGIYNNCYENIENQKYIDVKAIYSYNDENLIFSNQFTEESQNHNYKYINNIDEIAKSIIKTSNKNKNKVETLKDQLKEIRKSNNNLISDYKLTEENNKIYKIVDTINLY